MEHLAQAFIAVNDSVPFFSRGEEFLIEIIERNSQDRDGKNYLRWWYERFSNEVRQFLAAEFLDLTPDERDAVQEFRMASIEEKITRATSLF